jgi:hypothetical protein
VPPVVEAPAPLAAEALAQPVDAVVATPTYVPMESVTKPTKL